MDQMPSMDELYAMETQLLRGAMFSNIRRSALFSLLWLLLVILITNRLFSYTLFISIVTGLICGVVSFFYLVFLYTRQYRRQVQELAQARLGRGLNESLHQPGTFRRHVFGDRTTNQPKE